MFINPSYQSQLRVVATVILSLLLVVPFTVGAERGDTTNIEARAMEGSAATTEVCGAGEDCAGGGARVESAATMQDRDEDYNTPRSDRSAAGPDADPNVCDGVTCPDGSCAATADMCGDTATAADSVCNGYLCSDGTCASSEAVCNITVEGLPAAVATCPADRPVRCGDGSCSTNADRCLAIEEPIDSSSRSAVTNPEASDSGLRAGAQPAIVDNERVRSDNSARPDDAAAVTPEDADTDDDGLGDGSEPEPANYNNSRSNKSTIRDTDSDDDGYYDGTERAQNHNSSRSNRTTRAVFSDTETDGRPEVTLQDGTFVPFDGENQGDVSSGDGNVVCWGRAADADGKVYSWGKGICLASDALANATATAQERLAALQVRGDDVRSWTEEQQAAWQAFRETRATTSVEEEMLKQMVEATLTNERIQEIVTDTDGIGMRYQADIRLFGLIPMERVVTAEVTSDGEVAVDYPWYRLLSSVPEQSTIQSILTNLQAGHGGGGGGGKVKIYDEKLQKNDQ